MHEHLLAGAGRGRHLRACPIATSWRRSLAASLLLGGAGPAFHRIDHDADIDHHGPPPRSTASRPPGGAGLDACHARGAHTTRLRRAPYDRHLLRVKGRVASVPRVGRATWLALAAIRGLHAQARDGLEADHAAAALAGGPSIS